MAIFFLAYQIFKRTWKSLFNRPVHIVFSFFQPLFWLTIFGFLFQKHLNFTDGSYLDYLLPGICAMTVLQSSAQSGISLIKDFQSTFFMRYNFTPVSKFWFLFFKIFADLSRILFQIAILIWIGYLIGIKSINITFLGFFLLVTGAFLFTFFYASISCFIALRTKKSELMATFIQLFNLPIIFTSTALMPNKNFPKWLEHIANYNPLSHLSDIFRDSMINVDFGTDFGINPFVFLLFLMSVTFFTTVVYFSRIKVQ